MEVWPNVQIISGLASNIYLCLGDDGLTLIDAGLSQDTSRVIERVSSLGYVPSDLKYILVTHADIDHVGGLAAIQEWSGATVFAGEETAEHLKAGRSPNHGPAVMQWLTSAFLKYRPIPAVCLSVFSAGDMVPALGGAQALFSPGHTSDHFSFYCPKSGVLFAGDSLQTRGGRIGLPAKFITGDQRAANMSAIELLGLAPALIACGHGPPLSDFDMAQLMMLLNDLRAE